MAQKTALLIGVTTYGEGIPPLSAAANDVAAMEAVLKNPDMGGFDTVTALVNPDFPEMQEAIFQLFQQATKEDLVLLFFSGHGITDDNNHLYLSTRRTAKHNFAATAVPARFVQDRSHLCYAKRQVMILDCCYSGAFKEGWHLKSVGLDLKRELGLNDQGAEGRVVLTSSSATQVSFQQDGAALSLYTQYLVEGMETGIADTDGDGCIYIQELHDYAKGKVQEAKPRQKPEIILDREGYQILMSRSPLQDPKLRFRREVEKYAAETEDYLKQRGDFSAVGKITLLQVKRQEAGLTETEAEAIVASVREPYRRQLANRSFYAQALVAAFEMGYPLPASMQWELQVLRDTLGLGDAEVQEIAQHPEVRQAQAHAQAIETAERLPEQSDRVSQKPIVEVTKSVENDRSLENDRLAHLKKIMSGYQAQIAGLEDTKLKSDQTEKVRLQQRIIDLKEEMRSYEEEYQTLSAQTQEKAIVQARQPDPRNRPQSIPAWLRLLGVDKSQPPPPQPDDGGGTKLAKDFSIVPRLLIFGILVVIAWVGVASSDRIFAFLKGRPPEEPTRQVGTGTSEVTTNQGTPTFLGLPVQSFSFKPVSEPIAIRSQPTPPPTPQPTAIPTPQTTAIPTPRSDPPPQPIIRPTPTLNPGDIPVELEGTSAVTYDENIFCDTSTPTPITVRELGGDKYPIIIWRSEFWSSIGLTPEVRCNRTSDVLNNLLQSDHPYIVGIRIENGENIICVLDATRQFAGLYACESPILTLEPTEDPLTVFRQFTDAMEGGIPLNR